MQINDESIKESNDDPVSCAKCNTNVGVVDANANGIRIFKTATCMITNEKRQSYEPQLWIAAQLIHAINYSGVRRFIVQSQDRSKESEALMVCRPLKTSLGCAKSIDSSGSLLQISCSQAQSSWTAVMTLHEL